MGLRASILIGYLVLAIALAASAQQPAQPPTNQTPATPPIIKSQVRIVLLDSVVTDKKGKYIRDLTAKDFKIWEDNKEQQITTFSTGEDPAAPDYSQKKYMVLFFDTSVRDFLNQAMVRQEAEKFIEANVSPDRQIAVVDFSNTLHVAQNFTSDAARLKKAVEALSGSSTVPMSGMNELDAVHALRLALTTLARSLSTVPGRKTLVMFSRGFPLPANIAPDLLSEVRAAIEECNKANVAIYPIDQRALIAPNSQLGRSSSGVAPNSQPGRSSSGVLTPPVTPSTNQQVLDQFAADTGGFVIMNTNDILGGLEKIGKEQSQYYVLGYTPSESPEGSCHTLKVKVNRGGTIVRSRSEYCNVRPRDLLAGSTVEKRMETQASADMSGTIPGSMQIPFFYVSSNTARVNLALEFPSDSIKFEKIKGKMHAEVNILGIAYRPDNAIAARFSDTVNLNLADQQAVDNFYKAPVHYENQIEISSGQYVFKVVFSSGNETFGKLEKPLNIDPYNGNQFALSALVLSNQARRVPEPESGENFALLDQTRLIAHGMEITPSATNRFKAAEGAAIYAEVYDPSLAAPNPPHIGIRVMVRDRKSGEKKVDISVPNADFSIQKGSLIVRLGLQLPMTSLTPGQYQLQLGAADSAGHAADYRTSDFEIE